MHIGKDDSLRRKLVDQVTRLPHVTCALMVKYVQSYCYLKAVGSVGNMHSCSAVQLRLSSQHGSHYHIMHLHHIMTKS